MSCPMPNAKVLAALRRGLAIPAHPLALNARRHLDERRQQALTTYYIEAGAGGLAVGVHSTQFAIRDPKHGLLRPVLEMAMEQVRRCDRTLVTLAGVCGDTTQAVREATLGRDLGYDIGLLNLAAMRGADDQALIQHCLEVARIIPLCGFYLQPGAGGRPLGIEFWRRFAEIDNVVAIKIAPFNRYQTIDVVRAVAEVGRALDGGAGIALYTGNDDNIIADLLGEWHFNVAGRNVSQRMVGGLLGHWAYWTRSAVHTLEQCHAAHASQSVSPSLLRLNRQVTDMNAAVFDAANGYAGCIPGMHEVLRRSGLLEGTWCLDPNERLSPGQEADIDRVMGAYPHLVDEACGTQHGDG